MAVIPLRVHRMKKKLEKMQLKERLIYGYGRVILRMIVSGVLSLIVIGLLMGNMLRYVENVERADVAVKICRIDVNSAARNIREMALNSDTSTYDSYQQQVETQLAEGHIQAFFCVISFILFISGCPLSMDDKFKRKYAN